MDALRAANEVRALRAQLKRDLKAGRVSIGPLLLDPPPYLETAKVFDMPRRDAHAFPTLHLDRQPVLRGALQDAQVPPRVPSQVRRDRARARVLPRVLSLVQPRAPSLGDRSDDPCRRPPREGARVPRRPCPRARRRLRPSPRAVRPQATGPARAADRRLDQQAKGGRPPLNKFEREASHRA